MSDFPITIARNRVSPLSIQEMASSGFNTRFRVLYSDILYGTGSTDTVSMSLGSTPVGYWVDHAQVSVSTAFAGTTALTLAVGTTSATTAFISAQDILVTGQLEQVSTLPILTNATATTSIGLQATFTNATGGSPSALSGGQLDIYLRLCSVNTYLPSSP